MIEKNAYATYINNKQFLVGLKWLYYSYELYTDKEDFIILYNGEITLNILNEILPSKKFIPIEIPIYKSGSFADNSVDINYIVKKLNIKSISQLYSYQTTNTIAPFFLFSLIDYKKIFYVHCDMLFINNVSHIFKSINIKNGFYISNFHVDEKGLVEWDAEGFILQPNIKLYNYLFKDKFNALKKAENINIVIEDILFNYIPIKEIDKNLYSNYIWHCSEVIKYWNVYPNINIEKILLNKDKNAILTDLWLNITDYRNKIKDYNKKNIIIHNPQIDAYINSNIKNG